MKELHRNVCSGPREQGGAALITGLMLMAVLTILVATSMSSTILQERMGGNLRDRAKAFQRAEQAFLQAENVAMASAPLNPFTEASYVSACTSGYCRSSGSTADWVSFSASDWATKGIDAGDGARFLVKFIGYANGTTPEPGTLCDLLFHITVRAPGDIAKTYVYLQTIYRLRAGACVPGI